MTILTVLAGVVIAAISALSAYAVARRKTSGSVGTSDAETLFAESTQMRSELRVETVALKAEVVALRTESVKLREEAVQMRVELATLRTEALLLREEAVSTRGEMSSLRDRLGTLGAAAHESHERAKVAVADAEAANAELAEAHNIAEKAANGRNHETAPDAEK